MSLCPFCQSSLSDVPLHSGRCPVCGNLLNWNQDAAGPAEAEAPPKTRPVKAAWTPPKTDDPIAALKATLGRIVSRAGESGELVPSVPPLMPPTVPPLMPPQAAAPPVVQLPPAEPFRPVTPPPPVAHPAGPPIRALAPIDPSAKTHRGSELGTVEFDEGVAVEPPAGEGGGTPTVVARSPGSAPQKKPSTFDERRFAQTMDSASIPAEDTEKVAKLWKGTYQSGATPSTSLKGGDSGARARDSKLVIKHRALRETPEQSRTGADYELLSMIGEGGMGVVYAARQASIDRTVAIKMLKADIAGHAEQREKFLSEAVVTGDLDHPNIVPIYDLGSSEAGALFYSMKRVEGTPWMSAVADKSLPENIEILMKVADAVAFAHSRGVIHRDLKPENVMLGEFGEVLVMDWGLALSTAIFRKAESITQTSSMGGTPAYMAPEMATGPVDRIGPAADVYLLGAILYEILSGKPPHTGKNVMNCLFAAAKNEIQPTDASGELVEIALKAMATQIDNRYASVRDFQAAIREYQSHSESIVLSNRAADDLAKAEHSGDYQGYSRALFAYQEAAVLWDGNTKAKAGISTAKLAYARQALSKEDYDLGASLLDAHDPAHAELRQKIVAAQRERDTRQQRLKSVRRTAAALVAIMLCVATIAYFKVRASRDEAVAMEVVARDEKDKAVTAEGHARDSEKQARVAEKQAVDNAEQARKAEKLAKEDEEKARAAKEAEEYQAYVARIGLAAAKIDENAFDTAESLLDVCPPPLRNWEWGRLRYLSTQSDVTFETKAPIESVAYSADGKRFVSGGWDGQARIWDAKSGKQISSIPYGALYVHAVAFSPDGRYVALGGNNKQAYLQLFDAQTGAPVRKFPGHTDDVLSVAFSRDGSRLLTASYDRTARLWDVETGKEIRQYLGHNWWVWSAEFSPDEKRIVTASQDGAAIVWNTESGQSGPPFSGHSGPVYAAAFSPDGQSVVSGGYDNRLLIWKPADLKPFDYALAAAGGKNPPPKYVALEGHTAPIRAVAFSPNGKLVLSGSQDNTIKLWDFASGHLIKSLRGHAGAVRSAEFSPDGHAVLSGSEDKLAKLWDIAGYEEVRVLQGRVLQGHTQAVMSAAFSHDGRQIVTASRDRTAKTWDAATGQMIRDFEEGHDYLTSAAAFFPDGKRLLTAAADNTTRIWDVTTGTQTLRLDHTGRGSVAAVSHDGHLIVTGGDDNTAKIWNADADQPQLLRATKPLDAEVTAVAFSPDDKLFFTGDAHGVCTLWETASGAQLKQLNSHTGKITAADFLPDGKRVLTASNDNTVGQWDVASGEEPLGLILKRASPIVAVAAIPNSRQALALGDDGMVELWDVDQARMIKTLDSRGTASELAASADGRLALWVDYKERTVRLWDLKADREIGPPGGKTAGDPFLALTSGLVWSAAFSPDATYFVTVGGAGARLWDAKTAAERMSFTPHGAVASANFSPDGHRIVTGSWDNSAKIWNAETGHAELKLLGHTGYVNSACFSPDGAFVLTGSDDGTAKLWDAKTGKTVRTFTGHTGRVSCAVFSTDGKRVLTASADKTARTWDTETAKPLHTFKGHDWGLLSAAFSADGRWIITGSEDKTARIWDADSEALLVELKGHTASVVSVAFAPDGKRALTGSQDNTAKLWDTLPGPDKSGKEILTLKGHSQEVTAVSFSPDGQSALTSSRDGTAILWLAKPWVETAPAPKKVAAD